MALAPPNTGHLLNHWMKGLQQNSQEWCVLSSKTEGSLPSAGPFPEEKKMHGMVTSFTLEKKVQHTADPQTPEVFKDVMGPLLFAGLSPSNWHTCVFPGSPEFLLLLARQV